MINREWLYNECRGLVLMEIESLESAGALDEPLSNDSITHIANILVRQAVKEVTDQGIIDIQDYTVYESDTIAEMVNDLVMIEAGEM